MSVERELAQLRAWMMLLQDLKYRVHETVERLEKEYEKAQLEDGEHSEADTPF